MNDKKFWENVREDQKGKVLILNIIRGIIDIIIFIMLILLVKYLNIEICTTSELLSKVFEYCSGAR